MTITLRPSKGDMRPDGFRFDAMVTRGERKYQKWLSPSAYQRQRVHDALSNARRRALQRGVPFDVTVDDLLSIFPADYLCPIFGNKMVWGGDAADSPSLDRITPEKGYVLGNIMWISGRANTLKGMNSLDTLKRLVSFYEDRLKVVH